MATTAWAGPRVCGMFALSLPIRTMRATVRGHRAWVGRGGPGKSRRVPWRVSCAGEGPPGNGANPGGSTNGDNGAEVFDLQQYESEARSKPWSERLNVTGVFKNLTGRGESDAPDAAAQMKARLGFMDELPAPPPPSPPPPAPKKSDADWSALAETLPADLPAPAASPAPQFDSAISNGPTVPLTRETASLPRPVVLPPQAPIIIARSSPVAPQPPPSLLEAVGTALRSLPVVTFKFELPALGGNGGSTTSSLPPPRPLQPAVLPPPIQPAGRAWSAGDGRSGAFWSALRAVALALLAGQLGATLLSSYAESEESVTPAALQSLHLAPPRSTARATPPPPPVPSHPAPADPVPHLPHLPALPPALGGPPRVVNHTVGYGETLAEIAAKYGIANYLDVADHNGIVRPDVIFEGEVLKIPSPAKRAPAAGGFRPMARVSAVLRPPSMALDGVRDASAAGATWAGPFALAMVFSWVRRAVDRNVGRWTRPAGTEGPFYDDGAFFYGGEATSGTAAGEFGDE